MGSVMEYSADKEYYKKFLHAYYALEQNGWKTMKSERSNKICTSFLTKDGFAIYLLYGCEKDVKDELL